MKTISFKIFSIKDCYEVFCSIYNILLNKDILMEKCKISNLFLVIVRTVVIVNKEPTLHWLNDDQIKNATKFQ